MRRGRNFALVLSGTLLLFVVACTVRGVQILPVETQDGDREPSAEAMTEDDLDDDDDTRIDAEGLPVEESLEKGDEQEYLLSEEDEYPEEESDAEQEEEPSCVHLEQSCSHSDASCPEGLSCSIRPYSENGYCIDKSVCDFCWLTSSSLSSDECYLYYADIMGHCIFLNSSYYERCYYPCYFNKNCTDTFNFDKSAVLCEISYNSMYLFDIEPSLYRGGCVAPNPLRTGGCPVGSYLPTHQISLDNMHCVDIQDDFCELDCPPGFVCMNGACHTACGDHDKCMQRAREDNTYCSFQPDALYCLEEGVACSREEIEVNGHACCCQSRCCASTPVSSEGTCLPPDAPCDSGVYLDQPADWQPNIGWGLPSTDGDSETI